MLCILNAIEVYQQWLAYPGHTQDIKGELAAIAGDEAAISDRFYRDLEFGTGGLRGVLGAGTNRINVYTVRRATLGFARYIASMNPDWPLRGVVVAYDCRRMSRVFAQEVGLVLAAAGVRAFVFDHLCPTPELSFAVRQLGAAGGVMITASHNPPEYNGYKVYDQHGGQILTQAANRITQEIQGITDLFAVPLAEFSDAMDAQMFQWIGTDMDDQYCRQVVARIRTQAVTADQRAALKVVYTPLHGTGNLPVRHALQLAGYTQVFIEESQELPDGEFPTVKSPNPEEPAALEKALTLAQTTAADLAMGTDPDADRVGVAVRDGQGRYKLLTGNQVGGLLVDFVLQERAQAGTLPTHGIVFKTVVTSELGAQVARAYGVKVEDTLTGFKYIGDRIQHYEETGEGTFLFGYEESYGYLAADFVRDKDAVQICLLISEMAAAYKAQGRTLLQALDDLYRRVGYFQEELISATLPGRDGVEKIQALMATLRKTGMELDALPCHAVEDYEIGERRYLAPGGGSAAPIAGSGAAHMMSVPSVDGKTVETIPLPQADVLKYLYEGGSWLAVRPSGTEPKVKFYLGARASSAEDCELIIQDMRKRVQRLLNEK